MRIASNRLLFLFLAPHLSIFLFMWATRNTFMIGVLNVVNFALAVMVVIAYFPIILKILSDNSPISEIDRGDWLGAGIFLSWLSTIELRAYSIVWRWLGQPAWLTDSDILSYALSVQLFAGILHLAAPNAINHQVPTKQWIRIGIWVGIFVFLALVSGYFFDVLASDFISPKSFRN